MLGRHLLQNPEHLLDWEAWGHFSDCDDLVLIYNEACNLKEQIELCLSRIVFYYSYSNR